MGSQSSHEYDAPCDVFIAMMENDSPHSFRIARWVSGIVLAFCCPLGRWPNGGCQLAWRFSGMYTVKVHEWCLVCHGWLALCLCKQLPPGIPLQLSA